MYYFVYVFDEVGVFPFFAAITFLTIGMTIGANLTAVLTTFATFNLYQLLFYHYYYLFNLKMKH